MGFARPPSPLQASARPLPADESACLEHARTLQRAALAGRPQQLLRGKHLGLLCDDDTLPAAVMFCDAASELGAQVAHIGMSLSEDTPEAEVAHTARLLGRLYDAVECQALHGALVRQIAEQAGIPVYDGMALNDELLTRLALQLGPESALAQNRRVALQALLLQTIV